MELAFRAVACLRHFLVIPFINPYMEFNVGFTKEQTPLIYMVGGSCGLISSFHPIGIMADKYGKLRIFITVLSSHWYQYLLITNMPQFRSITCWLYLDSGSPFHRQKHSCASYVQPRLSAATPGHVYEFHSSLFNNYLQVLLHSCRVIVTQDSAGRILRYNWVGYLSMLVVFSTILLREVLRVTGHRVMPMHGRIITHLIVFYNPENREIIWSGS